MTRPLGWLHPRRLGRTHLGVSVARGTTMLKDKMGQPVFSPGITIVDDPFLKALAWEINEQSARQCREWADRVANADGKQRFVAGAIGPLTVSLSQFPDLSDLSFRYVTFDQVKEAYKLQARALIAE